MRKIKEVLRLHSLGLNQHQIARSCGISQSTVHAYLTAAEQAGVHWPLSPDWDDRKLEEVLFARPGALKLPCRHPLPDFTAIHEQMQKHKHVTLHLLWQEYHEQQEGYRYSRFCDLYRRWLRQQDVVLRQEHRAGEKLFVDWAGDTIPVYDGKTGEPQPRSSWPCWAPATIPTPNRP